MTRAGPRTRPFQALATGGAPTVMASPGATVVKGPGAADALLTQVERVAGSVGWRAVIFHLSRLGRAHRAEKHLQIAANMLEDVVREHSGQLFLLPNNDLVVLCKRIKAKVIQDAEETLQYLFNDDPFAQRSKATGGFSSTFDLEREHLACSAALRKWTTAARAPKAPMAQADAQATPEQQGIALDPARVGTLLETVSRLDLAPMLRRQTIWRISEGRASEAHSEEVFISIKALREAVGALFEFADDRLLFGYLTRWLDCYVLKTLSWEHYSVGPPLSLNVNLATLRSADFAKFHKRRPVRWHGRIMLEFQLGDVWSDLPAFLEAAPQLKREGYLICLDGVVFSAVRFLNLRRLEVDYVKVIWDDGLLRLGEEALRELWQSISDCGPGRMILTRCGRDEAIRIGGELGIRLFQGWSVNRKAADAAVKVDDAVELRYANGKIRLGTVREVRTDGVIILVGGAEGQTAILVDPRRLRPGKSVRWQLTRD
jgi:EAL domain-containing protein (putative c-di-GMP-specific phosphodiesterase class I)